MEFRELSVGTCFTNNGQEYIKCHEEKVGPLRVNCYEVCGDEVDIDRPFFINPDSTVRITLC